MNKILPTAKKTKKKFYNRYIYKISLAIPGTSSLRWHNFSDLLEFINSGKPGNVTSRWLSNALQDAIDYKSIWVDLIMLINSFDKKTFSKRIEGDVIDFYTNDKNFYESIGNEFSKFVRIRSEPKEGHEKELLDSEKKIFVNQLPYEKYQYRAYLTPHKMDRQSRISLAKWLDKQKPKITFTNSIEKWLIATDQNWDRRYIHVEDEQTLLMIRLRAPQIIGQIFKYVLNR
jgi:hypothetical protein